MKIYPHCIACQVEVRRRDIVKLFSDPEVQLHYTCIVAKMLHDLVRRGYRTAPEIATEIFRFLKRESGVEDPYREEKKLANTRGLELYLKLRRLVDEESRPEKKLEIAAKIALLGNSLDLGVAQYTSPPLEILEHELSQMQVVGSLPPVQGKKILYLLDNAGEAALDRLLAETLRELGNKVYAVVKSGAFQNDVTIHEVDELKLCESFDAIIETGTDAASIFLNEVSQQLKDLIKEVDLVIAKGMAHFEYITEIEKLIGKPVLYMMKVKCFPVSQEAGAPLGAYVIIARTP